VLKQEAKKTVKLAFPIILGEMAQMALHLIDTAMVGAVSYKHIAAASLVLSVMNIPLVFGIGITIAVSQMVSMAHGRHDGKMVSHYFYNGFWLCAIASVIVALAIESSKSLLFHLGQDKEVAELAVPFLQLMGWSVIPMILFMALKQFTDGLEYTKTAMLLSLVALPLNAFINWLLIFGKLGFPRLELVGAGWGTLITRTLIFLSLGIVILRHRKFRKFVAVRRSEWNIKVKTLKELIHIGLPSSLQVSMESGIFAVSAILIGTLGAVAQAAHQIAISIASFTFMVSFGLSQAASIRVSNAFGGGNWPKINTIGMSTFITSLIYGTFCAILFTLFRNELPLIFNNDTEVIGLAGILLLFAAIFQISDSTQAISAGLLRGIKDVNKPTLYIAVSYWIIGLPAGYLLSFYFKLGAMGMWIGFIIGLSTSSILLTLRFRKMVKKRTKLES
jgi:MATE family multidrug resistance protein